LPELPEVETIKNLLRNGGPNNPPLLGSRITGAQVLWLRTLAVPSEAEFLARLPGQRLREIGRRGKFLLFSLTLDTLIVHLRMSGDLWVEPVDTPVALHHRLLLHLEQTLPGQTSANLRLSFNDTRKFGRVWLVSDPQQVLGKLGPEPLDDDFTPQVLYYRLQATRRQLKPLLLDQGFLAGLGNIYTDEALNLARLHPLAPANSVTPGQSQRLWSAIRAVLADGIRHNGASIDWVYRGGDFQNYFRVYDREGQPCPECGAPIQRMVVGQRGTHFCPNCQRLSG
jgi:formamidopyrimidine-DNA glycosylase